MQHIIAHNYNKAKALDEASNAEVNYQNILQRQIFEKNANGEIFVLGTLPLMALDYNITLALDTFSLQLIVGDEGAPTINYK